jgi:hypothetical protein
VTAKVAVRSLVELGATSRIDRLDPETGAIYEIKPNTEGSIEAGLTRVEEYARQANAMGLHGRTDWRRVVVIYDAQGALRLLRP